ncbi:MAG: hypothetical protein VKL39_05190 [Leptolyngbyaceae bacterium]|nr:hypothetical protein [Leptolyngbyaceae bacterium]
MPISDVNGEKSYRAIAEDKHSVGRTAGEALDALTAQLGEMEFSTLPVIQNFRPNSFFSAEQQERLLELMNLWRVAGDQGQELSPEQQAELNRLVEIELRAATVRAALPPTLSQMRLTQYDCGAG